jgi:hypothetical protein
MVSKRADAPYRSGRTEAWVKTKCYQESELIVAGIQRERGKPSFAVMASPEDGRYVGSAFIVLPRRQRDRLYELAEAGGGKMPAGIEPKESFPAEWIGPRLLGRCCICAARIRCGMPDWFKSRRTCCIRDRLSVPDFLQLPLQTVPRIDRRKSTRWTWAYQCRRRGELLFSMVTERN